MIFLCYIRFSGDGGRIYGAAGHRRATAQAAAPGQASRAVPLAAHGDAAGHTHPRQVHCHASQRDRVAAQLSQ